MHLLSLSRRLRLLVAGLFAVIAAIPSPLAAVEPPLLAARAAPESPALGLGDENWSSQFRYPGINGTVNAILAAPNGDIYVGGEFNQADDERAGNVARWDGTRWHALGQEPISPYNYVNERVYALALGPDGSLYAGGYFDTIGGVAANNIARWDGAQWHPLGAGLSDPNSSDVAVYNIAVNQQNTVYVTGKFQMAGGVTARGIARWDGAQWHPLGSGAPASGELVIGPNNNLYVGNDAGVTRWDGVAWHRLGNLDHIAVLAIDQAGTLYAGGSFGNTGTTAADVARWDGTAWHTLGAGLNHYITAMALGPDGRVYVGGLFAHAGGGLAQQLAQWDGAAWTAFPASPEQYRYPLALAVAADGSLYAGGYFSTMGDLTANHIARWDGAQWHAVSEVGGEGIVGDVYVTATAPDGSLYAGGWLWRAGSTPVSGIARWDGAGWHRVSSELSGNITAITFAPDGTLYVAGGISINGGYYAARVARWDGAHWQFLGGELTDRHVASISALAVAPDGTLYAGGGLAPPLKNVARWDGAAWQTVGAGLGYGPWNGVSDLVFADDGALYASGDFSEVNGVAIQAPLARWDGTNWHAITDTLSDQQWTSVSDLELYAGDLYAASYFVSDEGQTRSTLARWDGAQWHAIGADSPPDGYISAIALDRAGNLFVGGRFSHVGAQPANNIARWDGAQWHPLGSGVNGQVASLAIGSNGRLSVGGWFTMAGEFGSSHIAQWTASDRRCDLAPDVPAIFYAQDDPVAITVRTPGSLACVSVQRIAASYPNAPAPLQTGAYWAIEGTDALGQPASGMTFDLSLPRADADSEDLVCHLEISWDCAAASFSTSAVTRTQATSLGIWAVAGSAVPASGWDLVSLTVDTSSLLSYSYLLYTLRVGASSGGSYTLTMDLDPSLTLLGAADMTQAGRTLQATGAVRAGTVRTYVIWVGVSRTFSGTITQTAHISDGALDRTLSAPPVVVQAATWDLSDLAVDTSALTSTSILTYTLNVGDSAGGKYLAEMKLHPALTLVSATGMYLYGDTLRASDILPPGAIQSFSVTVRVDPAFSGAITQTALISGGMLDRTLSAPPVVIQGATWDLSALAVDSSALTSTSTLTYTLDVGASLSGHYTATIDLHPALTVLAAPGMSLTGRTLRASGTVAPGVIKSFLITVVVNPAFSGTITQTALISGGMLDRTLSAPLVVVAPAVIAPPFRLYLPAIRR